MSWITDDHFYRRGYYDGMVNGMEEGAKIREKQIIALLKAPNRLSWDDKPGPILGYIISIIEGGEIF